MGALRRTRRGPRGEMRGPGYHLVRHARGRDRAPVHVDLHTLDAPRLNRIISVFPPFHQRRSGSALGGHHGSHLPAACTGAMEGGGPGLEVMSVCHGSRYFDDKDSRSPFRGHSPGVHHYGMKLRPILFSLPSKSSPMRRRFAVLNRSIRLKVSGTPQRPTARG